MNQLYKYGLLWKIELIFKGLIVASKSVKMVIRNEQVVAQGCQLDPVHGSPNRHLLVTEANFV